MFNTYYLSTIDNGAYVIYHSGHTEDNFHSQLWIVVWPEGFWN